MPQHEAGKCQAPVHSVNSYFKLILLHILKVNKCLLNTENTATGTVLSVGYIANKRSKVTALLKLIFQ